MTGISPSGERPPSNCGCAPPPSGSRPRHPNISTGFTSTGPRRACRSPCTRNVRSSRVSRRRPDTDRRSRSPTWPGTGSVNRNCSKRCSTSSTCASTPSRRQEPCGSNRRTISSPQVPRPTGGRKPTSRSPWCWRTSPPKSTNAAHGAIWRATEPWPVSTPRPKAPSANGASRRTPVRPRRAKRRWPTRCSAPRSAPREVTPTPLRP